MATKNSDFQKLLADAPMAPDDSSLTLVGALAKTADPAHFVLTLADGRALKLSVNAVKSAKVVAGAVGQTIVELDLDKKLVPEELRKLEPNIASHGTGFLDPMTVWYLDVANTGIPDIAGTGAPDVHHSPPSVDTLHETIVGPTLPQTTGAVAPFALATHHQAPQHSVDALMQARILKPVWADPSTGPFMEATHPAAIYHIHTDWVL